MIYRDRFCLWLSFRMPARFVMWAAVRVIVHATTGRHSDQVVPDLTAMDALKRWEEHVREPNSWALFQR